MTVQEQTQANTGATQGSPTTTPQTTTVVGGPGIGMDANTQAAASVQAKQQESQPIFVGNKKFNSLDEYNVYVAELERQKSGLETVVETYLKPAAARAVQEQPPADNTGRKLDELLYNDPDAFARIIQDNAKSEAKREMQVELARRSAWDQFYRDNPDLSGNEDLVELQRQQHFAKLKDLPQDIGMKELAKEARARIAKIRGTPVNGQQLPSNPAVTVGASGPSAPVVQQPKAQPSSFISELKAMRKNRA